MPMKFVPLFWLCLLCSVLCLGGGISARAKNPVPERKRSVHEEIILESIAQQDIVVVGCPFAFERKRLSPAKYEVITEYAVVRVLKGKLEFGTKFKVTSLVEGMLDEGPAALKPNLGDFRFLILYNQPNVGQPFEAAHALPYSIELESDVNQLLRKGKSRRESQTPSKGAPPPSNGVQNSVNKI